MKTGSKLRGAHIEGPLTDNFSGIDGWINGMPLSFKEATTSFPSTVKNQVVKAMAKAAKWGYRDVEVFVKASDLSSVDLIAYARTSAGRALIGIPQQSIIKSITVVCRDGVVVFPG